MTRSLATGMATAVAAETGEIVHLIKLVTSGGTTYLTTSATDISWDSQTWVALGGLLTFSTVNETGDRRAQGVGLNLSGVDQTIISLILSNHTRGRLAYIYMAHLSGGDVIATPLEIFRGYLNAKWSIREQRDPVKAGTVTVSTRIVSRLAALEKTRAVRANIYSHREMLRRSGATGAALDDTIFVFLPKLMGKTIYWGIPIGSGTGTGLGEGGGGNTDGKRDGDADW